MANAGREVLDRAWFEAVSELRLIIDMSESVSDRLRAIEILFDFYKAHGQSINELYIPSEKPDPQDEDDDD